MKIQLLLLDKVGYTWFKWKCRNSIFVVSKNIFINFEHISETLFQTDCSFVKVSLLYYFTTVVWLHDILYINVIVSSKFWLKSWEKKPILGFRNIFYHLSFTKKIINIFITWRVYDHGTTILLSHNLAHVNGTRGDLIFDFNTLD